MVKLYEDLKTSGKRIVASYKKMKPNAYNNEPGPLMKAVNR